MIRSSAVAAAVLLGTLVPAAAQAQAPSQACAPQVAQAQRAPVDGGPPRVCRSAAELQALLGSNYSGAIVVPAGSDWTLQGTIRLRSGVRLLGVRGPLGARPVLRQAQDTHPLFTTEGANDVRIEGLQLIGPRRTKDRFKSTNGDKAIHVQVTPGSTGRNIAIVDNEIDHWSVAVGVDGDYQADTNRDYNALCEGGRCPKLFPSDAGQVRVERNYVHENVAKGAGYGVVVGGGAYATIEGNVFEYNNHAIAASGRAFSGYVARYNYALRGVLTFGEDRTKPHNFDVHGRGGAKDKKYAGGLAGYYFDVSQNTLLGSQDYGFLGRLTRAAFALRGRPTLGARFTGNVLTHDDFDEAIKLRGGDDSSLDDDKPRTFGLQTANTKYDTDYSKEIAAGDFDGDGRDDVFVANGTGWFFSRGGIAPWEFLMPQRQRVRELHFADMDGDGRTDVITGGAGALAYHSAGRGPRIRISGTNVAAGDVRSGDFDADGRTDLFASSGGQWRIRSGRTGTWADAQTSRAPVDKLLFGHFDAKPGTDVLTIVRGDWGISSAARTAWTPVGPKRSDSLGGAVAHDFDGNGVTDIAFTKGGAWRLSRDARRPLETIRGDTESRLYDQAIGRFDGGSRIKVIGFRSDKLFMWNGLGSGKSMPPRSLHNMR